MWQSSVYPAVESVAVELPPRRSETETTKLLTLDHVDASNHDNEGSHDRTKLNIEEFECGLQFECSENAKQEWAFTLYDFDGHGKITKEDLASLLRALYDAVGSSIKLPPNGAKTLKLRLTVGQENVSHLQKPNIKSTECSKSTNNPPKHKVREFAKLNNLTRAPVKRTNENQDQGVVNQDPTPAATPAERKSLNCQPGMISHVPATDHQHLIDLVQENLTRKQGRQLRNHHNETQNSAQNRHKRQQRAAGLHCPTTSASTVAPPTAAMGTIGATSSKVTETTTNNAPKESQDRRNYYLDLAGVENNGSKVLNNLVLPAVGSGCLRTGHCKNRLRPRDVSLGAAAGVVASSDQCDISSHLPQGKCEISSHLPQEECNISSLPLPEKCSFSPPVTHEKCDLSSRLHQEQCDLSLNPPHRKCDVASRLLPGKCDISLRLPREKHDEASRLPQTKCDISSRLPQDKSDISSRLPQDKSDISLRLPQEKCDISSRLPQEKNDISLRLPQEKCDAGSRILQGKSAICSRLQQGICDFSSRLQQGKCDNVGKQEGERAGGKQSQGLPNNRHLRTKSLDVSEIPQTCKSPKVKKGKGWLNFSGGRFRPVSLSGQETLKVLPDYHRRSRHREKDRVGMMQQVAEWIEREHVDSGEASRVVVQRHEHHHIHEHHHHHHFHHHHET
ncbi:hypothetical protein BsWGS_22249 [Bradybaena similaris]